jgi:transcriptional regulator with GAF, ATPase, and Fis domain
LGAIKDKDNEDYDTNCLVIGVMNEDPDDISRERAMDFFRDDSYLGKFLGDLLYEHFMQIRRLRPDIKYRMIRNGKFMIPPLRERGEDIPMLFHVFVKSELKNMNGDGNDVTVHLPLDVLDRLTSPDLLWPGNVRQLQTLAKTVAGKLYDSNLNGDDRIYIVKLSDLERSLVQVELVANKKQF